MPKLYLLATNTKKHVSRLITAYTGERFNHASIAFDAGLAECYSFNMATFGFSLETKDLWPAWTDFALYAVEVSEDGFRKAKKYVRKIATSDYGFSYSGLASMVVGVDLAAQASKFCSQFVEEACVRAGAKPSVAASYLATPEAVCARPNSKLVSNGLLHSYLVAHGGGKPKLYEHKTMILKDANPPALLETERRMVLTEGLSKFLRNIATGDVEDEIEDLKKEAKDIHTPEQQRYVITKIVRLLERLIILRHNPGFVQKQYHDAVSWFGRVLGRDSSVKELSVRIGEALRDLAQLRDHVLAKRWNDDKYNQEVDKLKGKIDDVLKQASGETVSNDDDY
jgi:hypothetical protein